MEESIYQLNGYKNRKHYLKCMAEDYGVPLEVVLTISQLLGEGEDFDGLVNELEDYKSEE